jgi:hypothetical protein
MNIYRGFEYGYRNHNSITTQKEGYYFVDAGDEVYGPFGTDEACMTAIDKFKRTELKEPKACL